jgi:cysteinyl-tRNA synthetase
MNAISDCQRIAVSPQCDPETERIVKALRQKCYDAMNDDLATPLVLSHLFEACSVVNKLVDHKATICADCLKELKEVMHLFTEDILGLSMSNGQCSMVNGSNAREEAFGKVVDMVLDLRAKAKANKDWATSDQIRDALAAAGFEVKDTKDGATWKLNK